MSNWKSRKNCPCFLFLFSGLSLPTLLVGSLVIAVPSKDGLVVCADKRQIVGTQVDDNFSKLFLIRPGLAMAATGYPTRFYDGRKEFDAFDISNRILRQSTHPGDVLALVAVLTERLRSEFEAVAKSYDPADPILDVPPSYVMFQVGVFSLQDDKTPLLSLIQVKYLKPSAVTVSVVQQGPETFQMIGVTALGDASFLRELQSGHDPHFDHFRSDQSFMRFVNNTVPAKEESSSAV